MISEQQKREVAEMYQGEVYGEAFYCALLHLFHTPVQKHLIGSLLQLETETKARLRQVVFEHGGDIVESDTSRNDARAFIRRVEHMSWTEATTYMVAASVEFQDRYREIIESVPKALKPVINSMIQHEDLIIAAMKLASEGEDEKAIELVSGQLMLPLPDPPAHAAPLPTR
ncbi:MAG: hypothetical protein OXK73_17445 [Rhodospirillaceae bacterium]|nr:hypothetical protein [Rhodospirillaceae bacterium]